MSKREEGKGWDLWIFQNSQSRVKGDSATSTLKNEVF